MARSRILVGTAPVVVVLASALAAVWEGYNPTPYFDPVGIKTVCRGHTGGIRDATYTKAECDALFMGDLGAAYAGVAACVHVPLTYPQLAALTDAAFNLGSRTVCRSTALRLANSGAKPSVWCPQLGRYIYAGGRVLPGLVKRGKARVALCLQ